MAQYPQGLRKKLLAVWAVICTDPHSRMITGLMRVLADDDTDIDEVIWVLRTDARVLSSHPGIVGMVNFTGPRNGGKSWIALRLLAFLGEKNENYAKSPEGNYLCCKPRNDSEASRPVRAQFRGKKLLRFKEMPAEPIVPQTVKGLLDARDGFVEGRSNNSKRYEETGFPITWVMWGQGNSSVKVASSHGEDCGLEGKVGELCTRFELVEKPDVNNPRQRQADTELANDTLVGKLDGELWFWAKVMYPTLGPKVCKGRHLVPIPPRMKLCEEEMMAETINWQVKKWITDNLVCCKPEDASRYTDVLGKLKVDLIQVDKHVLTQEGLGERNRGQHRERGEKSLVFFKIPNADGVPQACRLK